VRHLGLTLVIAILASAGAGAAKAVADLSVRAPASGAAIAVLSERQHGVSPTVLAEAAPTVELGRRDGGSPLLRLAPRVLRTRLAEAMSHRSAGPAATRARGVERERLEFATALAEARAGLVSARSTAPPPPLFY
jgi:hypothetical protein